MRQAVNFALDRKATNEAACLGFCPPAGVIVPRVMDFALQVPPHPYDPEKAKQLLAEAGYPRGFDGGEFTAIPGFPTVADAALNSLNAVGIRVRMRPMERAAFYAAWRDKKLRGLFLTAVGNSGNAATRAESFMYSKGAYAHGGARFVAREPRLEGRPGQLAFPEPLHAHLAVDAAPVEPRTVKARAGLHRQVHQRGIPMRVAKYARQARRLGVPGSRLLETAHRDAGTAQRARSGEAYNARPDDGDPCAHRSGSSCAARLSPR